MSQQALDLRRSIRILSRRKVLLGLMVALGILAGGAYAWLHPPMVTSTALVLLPQSTQAAQGAAAATNGGPDPYTATQDVIATSNHVLSAALPNVRPAMSLNELRSEVHAGSPTGYIISISAQGKVAAEAVATANAVAHSYVDYISSAGNAVGHVPAQLLEQATTATGSARISRLVVYGLVGAVFGALIGVIVLLALGRADRRLRERDEIANSIGVPVLASFPVGHPTDAAGWTKLLEAYKPGALHSMQLRRAIQQLGTAAVDVNSGGESGGWSFAVLSLSSDPGAMALGPQLAVFAASQGIPTALVIGPQQDADVTATLQTACAAPPSASSERPGQLQVTVSRQRRRCAARGCVDCGRRGRRRPEPTGAEDDAHHRDRARGFGRCGNGRTVGPASRERCRRRPRNRWDTRGGSRLCGPDDWPCATTGTAGATENAYAYIWHNDGDQKVTDGDQTIIILHEWS